jgi:predicted lipoprotein
MSTHAKVGNVPTAGKRPSSIRASWRVAALLLLSTGLLLLLSGCTLWTVRSLHPAAGTESAGSTVPGQPDFSAPAYVDSIWQSKVLPTVDENATDLNTLLSALKSDRAGASQKYGHREGQRPYNFLVKGEAKVLSVDTASRAGTIKIDLAPGDGSPDATVQIGPVIRGTSLRDALPFIQFNLFTNQLQYADVSNALNDRLAKDATGSLDVAALQGKMIDFEGAFTLEEAANLSDILVTPVKIAAK